MGVILLSGLIARISFADEELPSVSSSRASRYTNPAATNPAATVTLPAPSDENPRQRLRGEWWVGARSMSFSERKDDGFATGVLTGARFDVRLAPWSNILIDGELRMLSSRVQARYDDDIYESELRLREGYVSFRPFTDAFDLQLGVLRQNALRSSLLISPRRAFPGAKQTLRFGGEQATLRAFAQQLVPTSYSLNTLRAEQEKTPSLMTETLELMLKPTRNYQIDVFATHFRYNQLPSVIAFDSGFSGNLTLGELPNNSSFRYEFDGFLLGSELCLCWDGPLKIRAGGQWLQNTSAPETVNRGQMLTLGVDLTALGVEWRPRVSSFFNERETTPAAYGDQNLGRNNRQGLRFDLQVAVLPYDFRVDVGYLDAGLINNEDAVQGRLRAILIGVETNRVPF